VYNMVHRLSDYFDFFIVTGDRDLGDEKPNPELSLDHWISFSTAQVMYVSSKNQKIKTFRKIIDEVHPDTIYLNSLFSFNFSLIPLWLKKRFPDIRFVLAPRGMLAKGAMEIKKKKKEVFIGIARIVRFYTGLVWHATHQGEKEDIEKVFGNNNPIHVAGNIATVPQYTFKNIMKLKHNGFQVKKFLFVSRFSRIKNVELLIQWFREFTPKYKGIKLKLIGTLEDEGYYRELKEQVDQCDHITMHLAMNPRDLAKYYAEAHFFCLPTRSENFGHVIIEALSYGCPVLISDRTPWRDLESKDIGWDLPLDQPNKFRERIEECIQMTEKEFLRKSEAASMFAHEFIFESGILKTYTKLLQP
jgi:glycosyltransferase involved in cell wall biosynthesis